MKAVRAIRAIRAVQTLQVCALAAVAAVFACGTALADDRDYDGRERSGRERDGRPDVDVRAACAGLPSFSELRDALELANTEPGGLKLAGTANNMWATLVNRDGIVCAVAFTGSARADQWPGSRVISAQKANTTNAFSLPAFALSSANLYAAVQPGGALFGLQDSNPVSTRAAYAGDPELYGTANDPMLGKRIGGVNVFGGGVALYRASGVLAGGIGVSGDTSCRDHRVAWVARSLLRLDSVPGGVNGDPSRPDNIIFDIGQGNATLPNPTEGGRFLSTGGFGHPVCNGDEPALALQLPPVTQARNLAAN